MPPASAGAGMLAEWLRWMDSVSDSDSLNSAYSERFTWKKTDIATSPGAAITASRQVLAGDVRAIGGWGFAETTGTAGASLRLRDGNSATGEVFIRVNLASNESTRDYFPKDGVHCLTGRVFIEVLSGSVEGVIYWR